MQEVDITLTNQIFAAAGSLLKHLKRKDWEKSKLSSPIHWSPYLVSSIQLVLNTKHPSILIWKEDYIQFFNERFIQNFSQSQQLGKYIGESANTHPISIWPQIAKYVKDVISTGKNKTISTKRFEELDIEFQLEISPIFEVNGEICAIIIQFLPVEKLTPIDHINSTNHIHVKSAQQNLMISDNHLRNLIIQSPFAILILRGRDFTIEFANEVMAQNVLHLTQKNIHEKKLEYFFPKENNSKIFEQLEKTYLTGINQKDCELKRTIKRSKFTKTIFFNCEFSLLDEKNIYYEKRIIVTLIDVSENIKTKQLLKETSDRLVLATDGTDLATWDLNLENNNFSHSSKLAKIFGFHSLHKIKYEELLDSIDPEDRKNIVEPAFIKALETGNYFYKARILNKNNAVHWIQTSGKVYKNENGKPIQIIGTLADITDSIIAERKLAHLGEIVRSSTDAIISKTLDGIIISWNQAAEKMFGYSETEIVGSSILRLIPKFLYHEEVAIVNQLRKGKRIHHFETKRLTKYNQLIDISLMVSPIYNKEGNIIGASKIARDITSQKKSEKLLEQQKEQLKIVIDTSGLGTWELNFITNDVEYSDRYLEIIGLPKDIVHNYESLRSRLHPNDFAIREAAIENAKKTGVLNYRGRILKPEGSVHWFESKGKVFYDDKGTPLKMIGTIRDLTKEKQIQQRIEESEQRFRSVADTAPVFIWMATPDKQCYFFNKAWLNFRGKTVEDETGMGWLKGVHPDDVDRCLEKYNEGFDTQKEFYLEYRMLRYDGEYRWISDNGVPRFDKDGTFEGFIGACMDVHQRIMFEEKLKESESRLRIAAYSGELGTWDFNPGNEQITWDASSRELFGISPNDPFNIEMVFNKIHPDDLKVTTLRIKQATNPNNDKNFDTEFRVIGLPSQHVRWIHAKGKAIFDNSGKLERFSGTVLDITAKKIALEELQESEQRYRFLANAMPQLVWTGDTNGNLFYFNDTVTKFTGFTHEQLLNGGWINVVHPEDRDANIELWSHSIKSGDPFLIEHRFKRFDGIYRWQLSRALALKDDEGKTQFWVGTSTDIDDLKKHEEQKNDFIKMANHELKTPVTTIKGYIQLLLKTHADTTDTLLFNSLQTVDKQVTKLTNLVSDLLDITKIERGSLPLSKEIFNIGDLVSETINDMAATIPTHNINLTQKIDVSVFADIDRISQVLINLFTNAFKYSPNAKEINVSMQLDDNFIVVSVQDFGIGIATKDQEKIFERFYRVSGKDEKTFPGFGIGLFIVNEIITLHNGKLWVDSEKDQGATFHFSLPVFKL